MGRKDDKARQHFSEKYEFNIAARVDAAQLVQIVDRSAEASASKMNGAVQRLKVVQADDGLVAIQCGIKVRMAGHVVVFAVGGDPQEDGAMEVVLDLHEFQYQSGSLGMKPQIAGSKPFEKFIANLKAELSALHEELEDRGSPLETHAGSALDPAAVPRDDADATAQVAAASNEPATRPAGEVGPAARPPAGWFPNPDNADQLRWWDGSAWTAHTHPLTPGA